MQVLKDMMVIVENFKGKGKDRLATFTKKQFMSKTHYK